MAAGQTEQIDPDLEVGRVELLDFWVVQSLVIKSKPIHRVLSQGCTMILSAL